MEFLDDYIISTIGEDDITSFTKEQVLAYSGTENYDICLEENLVNFNSGYIFIGARLIKDFSIIGGISIEINSENKNKAYIEDLFVNSNYRNQGVATNMLEHIAMQKKKLFKKRNIILSLLCEDKLQTFYEKEKFKVDNLYIADNQKILQMKRKI